MKKETEDKNLKKIRYYKGSIDDFKTYIEKRIKETKK